MRIDAHQHFWRYDPQRYGWIDDSMAKIRKDFLPEDSEPLLQIFDFDGCVAVQSLQTEDDNTFLLNLAEKNPIIKGVVGWVDLRAEDVDQRLSYFAKNPLFKGVRHIAQTEPASFLNFKDFQEGIAQLSMFDLTYDILIFPHQLEAAIKLVEKFPHQPFVLDHMAKPNVTRAMDMAWKNKIMRLAENDNVYCKISGLVTEAKKYQWKVEHLYNYIKVVDEAFGTDRLMYASDWPVCLVAAGYIEVLDVVEMFYHDHSPAAKAKIFGKNAEKFYRLF